MLTDVRVCSGGPQVSIDASQFRAGGEVTVVVGCSPQRSDLGLSGPEVATFSASATASIDPYRSVALAMNRVDDRRDSGSATVLMITLCFTFLAGSLVWLSRRLINRSTIARMPPRSVPGRPVRCAGD